MTGQLLDHIAIANKMQARLVGRSAAHELSEELAWAGHPLLEENEAFMRQLDERVFLCESCRYWCDGTQEQSDGGDVRVCVDCWKAMQREGY